MVKVNPAEVSRILGGADYPASKDDLISYAIEKGAEDSILNALRKLPDKDYNNVGEVTDEIASVGGNDEDEGGDESDEDETE